MNFYSKPTQVIFKCDNEVICAHCGEVFNLNSSSVVVISNLKWVDISEAIAGDISLGD